MSEQKAKPDTRNKRTKAQVVADRAVIADMMIEGRGIHYITEHINNIRDGYNLSMSAINYDINVIRKQWIESYLEDINAAKAKELARIDRIEMAAWDAWELSKRTVTKTEKERTENEQVGKTGLAFQKHRKVKAKTTETERDADKEFMKVIQWCVEQRCKILGINAPQRYDISWKKQAEAAGFDPEKVKTDLINQFVSHAEKGLS